MSEKEFMSHVRQEIIDLVNKKKIITIENEPERMNSYERNYLMPYWSDELLLKNVKYYIEQAFFEFRKTSFDNVEISYSEVLKCKLIHMLIERLEQKDKKFAKSWFFKGYWIGHKKNRDKLFERLWKLDQKIFKKKELKNINKNKQK